jgi:hypothetical protein
LAQYETDVLAKAGGVAKGGFYYTSAGVVKVRVMPDIPRWLGPFSVQTTVSSIAPLEGVFPSSGAFSGDFTVAALITSVQTSGSRDIVSIGPHRFWLERRQNDGDWELHNETLAPMNDWGTDGVYLRRYWGLSYLSTSTPYWFIFAVKTVSGKSTIDFNLYTANTLSVPPRGTGGNSQDARYHFQDAYFPVSNWPTISDNTLLVWGSMPLSKVAYAQSYYTLPEIAPMLV